MFRVLFLFVFMFFTACDDYRDVSSYDDNSTNTSTNKTIQDSNKSDDNITTPLQKELKQNLKKHLDSLSKELQDKRIDSIEGNQAFKNHMQHFESLYDRKDLPRDSGSVNLQQKFDKAYKLQEEQLRKLQQNTDEIMR